MTDRDASDGMARTVVTPSGIAADEIMAGGLKVLRPAGLQVASLRYFHAGESFAAGVSDALGCPLPAPGRAVRLDAHDITLAWRSPTETLLVTGETTLIAKLERQSDGRAGGIIVDQTGGLVALLLRGPRTSDLLVRLGSMTSIPQVGESRISRIAEVTVTALCVRAGDNLLLVERAYAAHLMGWMRATAADF